MVRFDREEFSWSNLIFAFMMALLGILCIYIGVYQAEPHSKDPAIYIVSGIGLLLFTIWFIFDTCFTLDE